MSGSRHAIGREWTSSGGHWPITPALGLDGPVGGPAGQGPTATRAPGVARETQPRALADVAVGQLRRGAAALTGAHLAATGSVAVPSRSQPDTSDAGASADAAPRREQPAVSEGAVPQESTTDAADAVGGDNVPVTPDELSAAAAADGADDGGAGRTQRQQQQRRPTAAAGRPLQPPPEDRGKGGRGSPGRERAPEAAKGAHPQASVGVVRGRLRRGAAAPTSVCLAIGSTPARPTRRPGADLTPNGWGSGSARRPTPDPRRMTRSLSTLRPPLPLRPRQQRQPLPRGGAKGEAFGYQCC